MLAKEQGKKKSKKKTDDNFKGDEVILKIIQFIPIHLLNFKINYKEIDKNDNNLESSYNNQLSKYLNACIVRETFQFQHEDKKKNKRRPDIGVPIKAQVLQSNYKSVFDIECKRLNTLMSHVKQYVASVKPNGTGGIERFKRNLHGTDLKYSAMIGYIENKNSEFWLNEINSWIKDHSKKDNKFWTDNELLKIQDQNYYSSHKRINSKIKEINLYHFFKEI